MGYEKFVKKVFPFIGNMYPNLEDIDLSSYRKIVYKVTVLSDVALYYADFENGEVVQLTDFSNMTGKMFNFGRIIYTEQVEDVEHIHWELGIAYQSPDAQPDPVTNRYPIKYAKGSNTTSLTPWNSKTYGATALYLLQINDGYLIGDSQVTASDMGLKEAFVVWDVNPDDVDWYELYKSKTAEERENTVLCTIYYK